MSPVLAGAGLGVATSMLLTLSAPANAGAATQPQDRVTTRAQPAVHTREQFEFIADAPIEVVWPLFGAEAERAWAPDWDPVFVWPAQAADQQGMVFKVVHGDRSAIWVNTCLDSLAHRVQYVYVLPDIVATVVTLRLIPSGHSTHVAVTYERTALSESANTLVSNMAMHDRASGPEWGEQINNHLRSKQ
ncbi:MAG: hypothetical protein ACJ8R9_19110 [Steroidobacteraceae bacterium]